MREITAVLLILTLSGCGISRSSEDSSRASHVFRLAGPDEPFASGPDVIRLRYISAGKFWYLGIFLCPDLSAGETLAWAFPVSAGHERVEFLMRRLAGLIDVPSFADPEKRNTEADKLFFQGIRDFLQEEDSGPATDKGRGSFARLVGMEKAPSTLKVVALCLLASLRTKDGDSNGGMDCREHALQIALGNDAEPFLRDDLLRLCLYFNLARASRVAGQLKRAKELFRTILNRYAAYRETCMYEESELVLAELEK